MAKPPLLYPQRKRCLRCRGFLAFLVVAERFCSYECAGLPPPSLNPADWPRQHYTSLPYGRRREKRGYLSQAEADSAAWDHGKEAYPCDYCKLYHIGSRHTPTIG